MNTAGHTDTGGSVPILDNEPSESSVSSDLAPISVSERIGSLDFIRGIAVMGILVANIVAFGQPFQAYMYPEAFLTDHGPVSDWLLVAQFVLIDGKMRALFTILFGAGLYLFMERTWARGGTRWRQMWRLFVLMLFGMVHFYLIWAGDILFYYAVIGFLVVPCLRWRPNVQLWVGITGYLVGSFIYAAMLSFPFLIADTSFGEAEGMAESRVEMAKSKAEALEDGTVQTAFVQSGDYAGLVAHRMSEQWHEPLSNALLFALETLPLMFLGVALYRMGFFSGSFDSRKLRRWGWIGVLAGASLSLAIILFIKAEGYTYVGWSPLPRLMMALGIAALLVVYSSHWTGWLAQRVSAAGRAAFSNYLGTSIVMLFVFHGWALGLFGELNRPLLYVVAGLTCALMLVWSKPWLDRYRYGPLEWLWRCLTYGKLFPLKR